MGDLTVGLAVILVGLAAVVSALAIHLVCRQPQEDEFTRLLRSSMSDKTPVARRRRIA